MRKTMLALAVLGFIATSAMAAPGDSWILPIDHLNGGGWTEFPGAGYGGASAWQGAGMDGVRRVYWALNNAGIPASTELYTIQVYVPQVPGNMDWQPVESQFNGAAGEAWPTDPGIPWAGMWGTNHEYVGSDANVPAAWNPTGAGPHSPETADFNAGANGIYMWLKAGSWLYAKWDFGWPITRTWSALKITQITPEPISMMLFALGGAALLRRKPRV